VIPTYQFLQDRIALWDKLKAEADAAIAAKVPSPIQITLPDGKIVEGNSWRTSPFDIASGISAGLAENTVIAKVNGKLWDLDRPLEDSCTLQLLKFDDEDAQKVFWHSTAHILGESMERCYGGCLCYGPPIENGFYYDMFIQDQQVTTFIFNYSDKFCIQMYCILIIMYTFLFQVSNFDFPVLENVMKAAIKEKQPFERLEMKKEDLLEMFKYNEFKVRILNEKVDTPTTTAYRCGPLIDLCLGPHVRHTGKIKAFQITKNSSTYWEGKADAESLQRVYGIHNFLNSI
jgi:threonyl-tRNA synthetase